MVTTSYRYNIQIGPQVYVVTRFDCSSSSSSSSSSSIVLVVVVVVVVVVCVRHVTS